LLKLKLVEFLGFIKNLRGGSHCETERNNRQHSISWIAVLHESKLTLFW